MTPHDDDNLERDLRLAATAARPPRSIVGDVMDRFGYVWAAMMFFTAVANLVIAIGFTAWWPLFVGVFPLASKAALFAVHFSVVQWIGQARLRRRAGGLQPVAAE